MKFPSINLEEQEPDPPGRLRESHLSSSQLTTKGKRTIYKNVYLPTILYLSEIWNYLTTFLLNTCAPKISKVLIFKVVFGLRPVHAGLLERFVYLFSCTAILMKSVFLNSEVI